MEEKKIIELISNLHNEYVKLNPTHPSDIEDWEKTIHQLQDIVGRRLLRKSYPEIYVSYTICSKCNGTGNSYDGLPCDRCDGIGSWVNENNNY